MIYNRNDIFNMASAQTKAKKNGALSSNLYLLLLDLEQVKHNLVEILILVVRCHRGNEH